MYKTYLVKILFLLFIPYHLLAYDFSYQKDDVLINLDFENNIIKEIKFDIKINGQRNFGIIFY